MTLPFENDTGPVIKRLAVRSIQTDKRRNLFVIVTIALAAALMWNAGAFLRIMVPPAMVTAF